MTGLIHQDWDGPEDPLERFSRKSVQAQNPRLEYRRWSRETVGVDLTGVDDVRDRSNIARYWALYEHGGWWVDSDVVVFEPFSKFTAPPVVGWLHGAQPALIGCVKGNTDIHRCLIEARLRVGSGHPPDTTGLRQVRQHLTNWNREARIFPLDSNGNRIGRESPLGVHLWRITGDDPTRQDRIDR